VFLKQFTRKISANIPTKVAMTSLLYPTSRREKDGYLKEPLGQNHLWGALSEDGNNTVEYVVVSGGYYCGKGARFTGIPFNGTLS
jgi:hypothetical protein